MTFKVLFIPNKRRLEDAEGIDSFALSETEKIRVIGKGAFASALLAKFTGMEVAPKEMLCKYWDEEGKETFRRLKFWVVLRIAN